MTNIASDKITLELNLAAVEARLAALTDSPVLREKLEAARASMFQELDELVFPKFEYDPSQQPVDDDDV
ncbi:hypothetical protein HFO99_30520 [Rhizobium leguminosarum]|uniref:hypothetical protein n=1 Tax=Rhizobium leguminosarum TaxID=384 RepID=UPI001C944D1A|nr:hypothetical protein [Rhizobium leguminosarum]MBY5338191.1 hypothetical protein [Rhizobium leguminosarum]